MGLMTLAIGMIAFAPTYASIGIAAPLIFLVVLVPLSGVLADHIGRRKPIMMGAFALYLALAYPLFSWVQQSPSFGRLVITQIVLCSLLGMFYGPVATVLVEQFPTRIRSTGLAIPYNLGVMIFGGFAQFFVTWLIHATGSQIAPVYYMMFGVVITLVSLLFITDPARESRGHFGVVTPEPVASRL